MIEAMQWQMIIPMFCQPIWAWFCEAAFVAGLIPTAEVPVEWAPPKLDSVNPLQDATTDLLETRAGFSTIAARPDLAPALGFHDCLAWARRLAADPEGPITAAAEPALRRMADGLAHRARALRLLGNGVHPLAAAHAWGALAAAHGLRPVDLAASGGAGTPSADGSL